MDDDARSPGGPLEVRREEAGQRLDRFLADRLRASRAETRRILARRRVSVGGRVLDASHKGLALREGERVEVQGAERLADRRVEPEPEAPLAVLAEGAGWLAVDKPAGVAVHPLEAGEAGTLLGAIAARRPELHGVGEGGLRSGVVHRLDVDTSGALLVASEQAAWERLRAAFREHRVEKVYRAIATGTGLADGELEIPLVVARRRPATVRAAKPREAGRARTTWTGWRVLETLRDATLLEVRTRTGFLHQVRAVLAHLGHPLVGDRLYGGDTAGASRHMLHAARVAFEEVAGESPDPADFAAVLRERRAP